MPAAKKAAAPKKAPPKKKAAPKKAAPKPVAHVPADPIAALNADNLEVIDKAVMAVEDALTAAEMEDTSKLIEARNMFEAQKHHDPFRFLISAAYAAGKK